MKLMIASDIHGSATYLNELLAAYDREAPDRLILLGDLLYHGPRNDLPDGYDPKAVLSRLNELDPSPICVRGNCDSEVDQMVLNFPITAESLILYVEGRMVFATHGHILGMDNPPALRRGDVLLTGHTHVPAWEDRGDYYYVNPGSVSLPKEDSARSYLMLEGGTFTWKTLEGGPYHALTLEPKIDQ